MKLAVIGANGKAGRLVVNEAMERGINVTAIVRGANQSKAAATICKDALTLTAKNLTPFDVAIDAVGAWTPETLGAIPKVGAHLCEILAGSATRLLVVGGAGSLFVNAEHTATVEQSPDFPDAFKSVSAAHGKLLAALRKRGDVRWTYVSPACDFQAEGKRTGSYTLGGEELIVNADGQSVVSYADYAIAMVDLAENGGHERERVSVCGR